VNIKSRGSVTGSPPLVVARSFASDRGERRGGRITPAAEIIVAFPPVSAISFASHSSLSLAVCQKAEVEQKEQK
jgi:hypothetical protein